MKVENLDSVETLNNNEVHAESKDHEVLPTDAPAKSIKAIDKTTVHRICSGQVVLTLATAVKELVENSIDAQSTSVDVRLKEHGSTLIEVSDNGKGVEPEDFEGLTLKHHTSKLQDFGDLIGVKTFGFRGEALSSLCALSNLTILTRHKNQAVGTKLVYNTNGRLIERTPASRQVGTTVSLQNLFHTLPVRHKEFLRNLKKDFNKMVQVLYSYCLITTQVRILCTNENEKGGRTTIVKTESQSSLKENISSIFGHKQVAHLLEIKQSSPKDEVLSEYGVQECYSNDHFQLVGYISSCAHGKGRSAADRQFYFINSRPCDPSKVVRVVNDVFHHYNKHQFPSVVLDIRMADADVDVNVTPDKRQIMVNRERMLLATVKTTLISLYESIPSSLKVQNSSLHGFNSSQANFTSNTSGHKGEFPKSLLNSPVTSQMTSQRSPLTSKLSQFASQRSPLTPKLTSLSQRFGRGTPPSQSPFSGTPTFGGIKRALAVQSDFQSALKQPKLQDFSFKLNTNESPTASEDLIIDNAVDHQNENELPFNNSIGDQSIGGLCNNWVGDLSALSEDFAGVTQLSKDIGDDFIGVTPLSKDDIDDLVGVDTPVTNHDDSKELTNDSVKVPAREIHTKTDAFLSSLKSKRSSTLLNSPKNYVKEILGDKSNILETDNTDWSHQPSKTQIGDPTFTKITNTSSPTPKYNSATPKSPQIDDSPVKIIFDDTTNIQKHQSDSPIITKLKTATVPFTIESCKHKLSQRKMENLKRNSYRKFKAKIDPTDNQTAEEELKKEISKESFKKMCILGQFNLGFIVARLHSDLFIIDQHATDEKYNYESLQKTCSLQNQKLILPQQLELTMSNEGILKDNLYIFTKNGFEFKFDESECPGRRVCLTSMPCSRGWEFTKDDVEEMIFMLSDSPGVMCRPSRVSAMFASRACRKSVMVGTALGGANMRRLVDHMGDMDQPWNCPHGRPTIRHLVNLDMIAKLEE